MNWNRSDRDTLREDMRTVLATQAHTEQASSNTTPFESRNATAVISEVYQSGYEFLLRLTGRYTQEGNKLETTGHKLDTIIP